MRRGSPSWGVGELQLPGSGGGDRLEGHAGAAGQAGTGAAIAVLKQIDRIAQNGVWYESEGDRAGRDKVAGYDRLKATVYIDGDPYEINMRVRMEDKTAGGENRFYYFTPEVIQATKEADVGLRRVRFRERTMEGTSASGITLSQKPRGVNTQPTQTESVNIPETEGLNNGVYLYDGGQRADGAHPGGSVSAVEGEAGRDPSGQVEGRSADDGAAQKAAETTETAEARGPPAEGQFSRETQGGGTDHGREMDNRGVRGWRAGENTGEHAVESSRDGRISAESSTQTRLRVHPRGGGQSLLVEDSEGRGISRDQAAQLAHPRGGQLL